MLKQCLAFATAAALAACANPATGTPADRAFSVAEKGKFDEPWAMAFLPDGGLLITEKRGRLKLRRADGQVMDVKGAPAVEYGGQGGLGDVVLDPGFATNGLVWLSWVEAAGDGTRGAVVGRARLAIQGSPVNAAELQDMKIVWIQDKTTGRGHFGHRLAFASDGALFISSGERQKFDPAQDPQSNLGKIVRIAPDGAVQTWSSGHRNPLGLAFDASGNLWEIEMGPAGGDELNLVQQGGNYGYPKASNGSHYDGRDIPDHAPGDGFVAPKLWWNPSISPGSLMIYSGELFKDWKGDAFIGALGGEALVRADLDGTNARKADIWQMGARIREVEQAPDGAIWLLEDGEGGRLLRLAPR